MVTCEVKHMSMNEKRGSKRRVKVSIGYKGHRKKGTFYVRRATITYSRSKGIWAGTDLYDVLNTRVAECLTKAAVRANKDPHKRMTLKPNDF